MYNDIIRLLDQRRVKEALTQLNALTAGTDYWKLKSEAESLQTTYSYMLQYAAQGMEDPEQGKLYRQIVRRAYELTDQLEFLNKYNKEYGQFADKMRQNRQSGKQRSYQELCQSLETFSEDIRMSQLAAKNDKKLFEKQQEIRKRHEADVDELFDRIWTSASWSEEEISGARQISESLLVETKDLAVIVSAVTLNLLQLFDPAKLLFLINVYRQHSESLITQRALTGILLAAYYHEQRLGMYPELQAALSMLAELPQIPEQVNNIQTLLLLSRETEKIEKKMREDIIPHMLRTQQMIDPDMKIEEIDDLEEFNPEWKKSMDIANEKIRELGELQMEGADTYMGTFAQLKTFPFFQQAAHWFYPFSEQNSEVASILPAGNNKGNNLIKQLMELPMFCNSDRYSFCFTFMQIPQMQRNIVTSQLLNQNLHLNESIEQFADENRKGEKTNITAKLYLQDLYRFFKLWAFRKELHDIFTDDFALWKCKPLASLCHTPEILSSTANLLFSKGYWQEAAELFSELEKANPGNAEIMQKLGFSLLKQKKYPEAVQAFRQADLLNPDHVWTLRHLAQCYKHLQDYPKALEYFEKVKEIQPDNLNLLLQIGQCLATQRMYDQALSYFFKVEYLDKTPVNARRAIGWCYFMTGKYEEALRFYQKLLQTDDAQASDWLNAGHVYLAQKNIPKALEHYRQAESLCESHEKFIKLFLADREALTERQIQEETISLIPDLL